MEEVEKVRIEYQDYFIAFLDVLGFKDMVFGNKKDQIEKYFGLVKNATNRLEGIKEKQKLKSIIISDSVILSIPFGKTNTEKLSNLRHLCVAICKIQSTLSQENIWLRGAISCGKSYFNHQDNLVVGPAYVKTYLLEENHSKFPRVILDNKIINDLKEDNAQNIIEKINNHNFGNWTTDILFNWEEAQKTSIPLQQDVSLFIDFLSQSTSDLDMTKAIIKHLKKNLYSDNVIYPKYRWVVDYLISHYKKVTKIERHDSDELNEIYNELKRL